MSEYNMVDVSHFIFGVAFETCCTTLFGETLLSLSVKYLEGDC